MVCAQRVRVGLALALCAAAVGCSADPPLVHDCLSLAALPSTAQLRLEPVFSGVDIAEGIALRQAPGADDTWYLATQRGVIHRFANTPDATPVVFGDLSEQVVFAGEAGLLGLAFHPDFASNATLFVSYTTPGPGAFLTRVSRFVVGDDDNLDMGSEQVVFELSQPYSNHNGGDIHFGPEGYLYLGLGDGGSGEDPHGHGQNTDTLLGAMLRFDVDSASPYAIPSDNPFAAGGGAPEIYAWGLRNPWRFSFDRETGELWAGDVGQYEYEEVDVIRRGGNYGWALKEGAHCFAVDPCDGLGLDEPVVEYANPDNASVVGGYVYRGAEIPELVGRYVYTDFYLGTLWSVVQGGEPSVLIESTGRLLSSFAEDAQGELFALDYAGGVVKLVANSTADAQASTGAAAMPTKLSRTGCVDVNDPTQPNPDALRYDVALPFWSDGAAKERWAQLPEDAEAQVDAAGDWDLPAGSVLTKVFRIDEQVVETRLMIRHEDGRWAGYSYAWDEDGNDATLLLDGETRTVPGADRSWTFPSRSDCMACHTSAAGGSLGLESGQMLVDDQLDAWVERGWLAGLPQGEAMPAPDADADLESRARAYLHVNCSFCHRPGGASNTSPDFMFFAPASEQGTCDVDPSQGDLGVANAKIITPGDATASVLALRMAALGDEQMPTLGRDVIDEDGLGLIEDWINAMTACP